MKYCEHCGAEIHDEAVVCVHCGCSCSSKKVETSSNGTNTLLTIARVFMIISCVAMPIIGLCYAFIMCIIALSGAIAEMMLVTIAAIVIAICFCLPLAWMIPMTVTIGKKIKYNEPIGIAMKICTLLFVNPISGVLLLCYNDEVN